MKFILINNNEGLTIVELVIAMGISAILLIFIISGSLFVESFLNKQSQNSNLTEEINFINQNLNISIENSKKILLFSDSIVTYSKTMKKTVFSWNKNKFSKNNQNLLSNGFNLDTLLIEKIQLQKTQDSTILNSETNNNIMGVYEIIIKISDNKNNSSKTRSRIVNRYESTKYNQ